MFTSYFLLTFIFTGLVPIKAAIEDNSTKETDTSFPKNVVLIVTKGMSSDDVVEARVEEAIDDSSHLLSFENFPCYESLKNYDDNFIGSGLMSASALFRGTYNPVNSSCNRADSYNDDTIISSAQLKNKSTGLVTTMRLTAPLPATLYGIGHGSGVSECPKLGSENCTDASHILIYGKISSRMDVIFGYGRDVLGVDANASDNQTTKCGRIDGRNLIEEWRRGDPNRVYLGSAKEFSKHKVSKGKKYIGTFLDSEHNQAKPLIKVVIQAIQVLKSNRNGYFLVVIIDDLDGVEVALKASKLVERVRRVISTNETLLIVTSDYIYLKENCNEEVGENVTKNSEVSVSTETEMKMRMTANGSTSEDQNNSTLTSSNVRFMNPCNHSRPESKFSDPPLYILGTCSSSYPEIIDQAILGQILNFMGMGKRVIFALDENPFSRIIRFDGNEPEVISNVASQKQITLLQLILFTVISYFFL